ncbi:glycosyltransferase family 2 protein [Providencia alcalifaciens]|uniref:glycosyltransferase family 2 protein n=1 Tax=Providencia alcalifaciens TaxID=126385 RepID=UPI00044B7C14|nr:glycosyltransferase family 2 protein [Providencia alcalifaciens]ETT07695.1 glycosyltransferase, group 2 family protein [Providencia alcalifaciens F90-2004]EUC95041.1 glycosyltransferase, group 2 family protein [Providencia alcalifaciens PAL-2]MTB33174.1 glycosyltransferase [Providencia alcalifaciens]MTC97589.1 glycosyltransferase [Providencia alcalifaciens]
MLKLDILIPTYNRANYLEKNILALAEIIETLNISERVSIIVSNNNSTDDTKNKLKILKEKYDFLNVYNQIENIGLEKNSLLCLEKSTADFVMYLGDDDYLSSKYIEKVLHKIDTVKNLHLITPSYYHIDTDGNKITGERDIGLKEIVLEPGIASALYFSYRGHQLSGLTFKRLNIHSKYSSLGVSNLYPFIFFATYSSLCGISIHLPEEPVRVTTTSQINKDWTYGHDGLLNDVFNNFAVLNMISYRDRVKLEQNFLRYNSWRYISAIKKKPFHFIYSIISSSNTSIITKLSYIYLIPYSVLKLLSKKIKL